ncbi:major facilitator superfamily domain-containing protein [Coprinopsis sp. MPI-PUGE-AT-0042]|nr:major facilitator superfamily domain-containing protein [Coprinopsis sp. MPI-PUGE-AT-0042]
MTLTSSPLGDSLKDLELGSAKSKSASEQTNPLDSNGTSLKPAPISLSATTTIDIEHAAVEDDPRNWSSTRKNVTLVLIASASMIAGLAGSIQNPAVREMELDLPATSSQFSLSISLFILMQGLIPLVWSAISEIKGRKLVYITSLSIFTIGAIMAAVSPSIGVVIASRCIQAAGCSIIAIGSATLADIYEPYERGTKMGVYYIAPLLGPALGPIFGGVLTTGLNWRAIFWFLAIACGTSVLSFVCFFKDTFRLERSLIYQNALRHRQKGDMKRRQATKTSKGVEKEAVEESAVDDVPVKLSLADVNPIKPIGQIIQRINNLLTLFASGLLFAFTFLIQYTVARTLSTFYGYEALKTGLVSLCFGFGCVAGSVVGGRFSDFYLSKLKNKNQGISQPEMRLSSTLPGILLLPLFTLAFGWVCQQHLHISAICVFLFCCGFLTLWIYASTLAYIVDANQGRSSTAAATNSAFRGVFAFVAIEIAVPMQDGLGDGWMYTIWTGILMLSGGLLILVQFYGQQWRERAEARENKSLETPAAV